MTPTGAGRWANRHKPHRPSRNYGEFGPFVFDATHYRNAPFEAFAAPAPDVREGC